MTLPADTTPNARALQLRIFREMSGPARLAMALEMSDDARAISEAGIRHRHPEWSEAQVHGALVLLLLGDSLARKVLAHPLRRR
jgi:Rv0078B-related antitoxin